MIKVYINGYSDPVDIEQLTDLHINIHSIAKSLSNQCRFAGHFGFFSVAEHSVLCAELALKKFGSREIAFEATG